MGRLIDADKLLEETRRDRDYARKNGFLDMYYERQVLIDRIKAQPTAYDPEKVVEQLEEIRLNKTCNKEKCDAKELCRICVVDDAIEIVKQGGVSDDVCEWKSVSNGEFIQNPHTKRLYSNEPSMRNVYCNTCGKKIKIVGD